MARDPRDVALSAMTIVEVAQFFSAYNPSWFTIRTLGADDPEATRKQIRQGTVIASVMSLAFGALVSWLLSDPLPLVFSVVAVIGLASVYEAALASLPPGQTVRV